MSDISRRAFTGSVLTSALAPLLGPGLLVFPGWWEPQPGATAASPSPGDLEALAGALTGVVRAQYGERLTEADLAAITRHIRNALERAEQMRRVELANGDEPDFVFTAPAGLPG